MSSSDSITACFCSYSSKQQENDFSNQYHNFKDRVSKNPSSENLIASRELLDNQIKK